MLLYNNGLLNDVLFILKKALEHLETRQIVLTEAEQQLLTNQLIYANQISVDQLINPQECISFARQFIEAITSINSLNEKTIPTVLTGFQIRHLQHPYLYHPGKPEEQSNWQEKGRQIQAVSQQIVQQLLR